MNYKTVNRFAILMALTIVPGAHVIAAEETDTMTVSATVVDSCTVTANDLGLGDYDSTADVEVTTTVDVTCTSGATYDIGLDGGGGADVANRVMSDGGTGSLNYGLFSDAGHTTNWGNTVTTDTVADTGDGSAQLTTVYGQIPAGQTTAAAGAYTDTITATVTY